MQTSSSGSTIMLSTMISSSPYSSPMIPLQLISPIITTPTPTPSDKLAQKAKITCTLLLHTTQVAAIKRDLLTVLTIDDGIEDY
jgi:hypothetical protein